MVRRPRHTIRFRLASLYYTATKRDFQKTYSKSSKSYPTIIASFITVKTHTKIPLKHNRNIVITMNNNNNNTNSSQTVQKPSQNQKPNVSNLTSHALQKLNLCNDAKPSSDQGSVQSDTSMQNLDKSSVISISQQGASTNTVSIKVENNSSNDSGKQTKPGQTIKKESSQSFPPQPLINSTQQHSTQQPPIIPLLSTPSSPTTHEPVIENVREFSSRELTGLSNIILAASDGNTAKIDHFAFKEGAHSNVEATTMYGCRNEETNGKNYVKRINQLHEMRREKLNYVDFTMDTMDESPEGIAKAEYDIRRLKIGIKNIENEIKKVHGKYFDSRTRLLRLRKRLVNIRLFKIIHHSKVEVDYQLINGQVAPVNSRLRVYEVHYKLPKLAKDMTHPCVPFVSMFHPEEVSRLQVLERHLGWLQNHFEERARTVQQLKTCKRTLCNKASCKKLF